MPYLYSCTQVIMDQLCQLAALACRGPNEGDQKTAQTFSIQDFALLSVHRY